MFACINIQWHHTANPFTGIQWKRHIVILSKARTNLSTVVKVVQGLDAVSHSPEDNAAEAQVRGANPVYAPERRRN